MRRSLWLLLLMTPTMLGVTITGDVTLTGDISISSVSSDNPTAAFTARITQGQTGDDSCVAPCGVMCDAIGDGTTETTDADYPLIFGAGWFAWDFYDGATPPGNTWTTTGNSADTATGPIAMHVYRTAGTYTTKLTVTTPDGGSDTATWTVTVTDPDDEFTDAETFCLADITGNGGSFLGCPLDSTGADGICDGLESDNCVDGASFSTWAAGGDGCSGSNDCPNADATSHRRLLLRAGDTFTSAGVTLLADATTPSLLQTFGTGKATLNENLYSRKGWTYTDLNAAGITTGNDFADVGYNTFFDLVLNQDDLCIYWASDTGDTSQKERAVFAEIDCSTLAGTDIVTPVWLGGWYIGVGGLHVDRESSCWDGVIGATEVKYTSRSKSLRHSVMSNTLWENACLDGDHWQFRAEDDNWGWVAGVSEADPAVGAEYWKAAYNVISDNIQYMEAEATGWLTRVCNDSGCNCANGSPDAGPVPAWASYGTYNGCPGGGGSGVVVPIHDWIFERNFTTFNVGSVGGKQAIYEIPGYNIWVRNEVVDIRGALANENNRFIHYRGEVSQVDGSHGSAPGTNIFVDNNTYVVSGTYDSNLATFRIVENLSGGCVSDCYVRGNGVAWTDGGFASPATYTPGHTNWTASDNPMADGVNPFDNALSGPPGVITEYVLDAASAWLDAGFDFTTEVDSWVSYDFYGNARPADSAWDAGASEPP